MTIYRITGTLIRSSPADTTYRYYLEAWDADEGDDDGLATTAVHITEDETSAPFTLLFSSDRLPVEAEELSGAPELFFKLYNIRNASPFADSRDDAFVLSRGQSGSVSLGSFTVEYQAEVLFGDADDPSAASGARKDDDIFEPDLGDLARTVSAFSTDVFVDGTPEADDEKDDDEDIGDAVDDGALQVHLVSATPTSAETFLWNYIKSRSAAMGFPVYQRFLDAVLCDEEGNNEDCLDARTGDAMRKLRRCGLRSTDAYSVIKGATEAFLLQQCGHAEGLKFWHGPLASLTDSEVKQQAEEFFGQIQQGMGARVLPYFETIRQALGIIVVDDRDSLKYGAGCTGILRSRVANPCFLELIWSYWHEQGMLVQTMGALSLRFQNRRLPGMQGDPLSQLAVDPLRPLGNLMWGYIQDEGNRLSVPRRAYEYTYEYGLAIEGKAVPKIRAAESRAEFLSAFHGLLQLATQFFREDNDSTLRADAFPVLNALRDLHFVLAKGAHNQYGDLPTQARSEMLIQQYLLARPETRDFLGGRPMVPYGEGWMDRVETMKGLLGWPGPSITHFRDLGHYGEQLLLSTRFGNWSQINDPETARAWAHAWRGEIQRYVYAYRAVTGVDLSGNIVTARLAGDEVAQPSALMHRRHAAQASGGAQGDGATGPVPTRS